MPFSDAIEMSTKMTSGCSLFGSRNQVPPVLNDSHDFKLRLQEACYPFAEHPVIICQHYA